MNRQKLIQLLKANGYTGSLDPKAIKAWLAENNIELTGADGKALDVEAMWAKAAKITADADAKSIMEEDKGANTSDDDVDEVAVLKSRLAAIERKQRLGLGQDTEAKLNAAEGVGAEFNAKAFVLRAERKAYDRRAALGLTAYPDADTADVFGAYARLALAQLCNRLTYPQKVRDTEILLKAQVEYDNAAGGALVPIETSDFFYELKTRYGVARQYGRVERMGRDKQQFARRVSGTTVYFPGEGGAITASQMAVAPVTVVATKMAQLTQVSSELQADNAFNFAEKLTREMAYQFAKKEDECFFVGDGTATYGNITGLTQSLFLLSGTIANIAGLFTASSGAFASITLPDFESTVGLMDNFDQDLDLAWYVHPRFYWTVMARLALASGGVTAGEVEGKRTPLFLGYPVRFTHTMPRVTATTKVVALFGDIRMAGVIGDREGMRIDTSEHRYFDQDLIAFRGLQRVGVTIYDVGNANATEASRQPGPVVGLITPA